MNKIGYFVKFNNYDLNPKGTGKLHYEVLQKEGKVIWGQWTKTKRILTNQTYKDMNEEPFYLYALDKNTALLKMKVIRVLRLEEVIQEELEYLLPKYYSLELNSAAYFLIDNIEILPVEYGQRILTTRSKTSILSAKQVASFAPWKVYEEEVDVKLHVENEILENEENKDSQNYTVYCYRSKINGKCYIGQTNNISRRRKEHENPNNWRKNKKYLYILFSIQGLESFDFIILYENLKKNEVDFVEAMEIEKHNAYYPTGLNERNERKSLSK